MNTTRAQAKQLGLQEYFTGEPCKRGHIAFRYVTSGSCKECLRERHIRDYTKNHTLHLQRSKEWKEKNRDKVREQNRLWNANNQDKRRQYQRKYTQAHPNEVTKRGKVWRDNNPDYHFKYNKDWRANHPNYAKLYRDNNRGKFLANHAAYRAAKKQASAKWSKKEAIEKIYEQAKTLTVATGVPHEVDHIVPLQHPVVCGLHCEDNLQILTKHENRTKFNHFEEKYK